MVDLLDEANQEYAFQKRVHLFKRSLPVVAIITLLLIAIIGIKDWYADSALEKQGIRTSLLIEALETNDAELRREALLSLTKQKDGISDLAYQNIIPSLMKSSDKEALLKDLMQLINVASSPVVANLAKIGYVGILLDKDILQDEESRKIQNFLISIDKTQALYLRAQIYLALYNIKIGNLLSAKDIIKKFMENTSIPEFMKVESNAIIGYINQKEMK